MKYAFIFLAFAITFTTKAVAQTYSLERSEVTYADLENDTILSSNNWVGELYNILLPFSIRIGNRDVNSIFIFSDGAIYRLSGGQYSNIMYAYGNCGLKQKGGDTTSHISYVVEGESPNRIAKIQFKNASFAGDETNTDYTNFQIWFHEGGMANEIIFGPTALNQMRAFNGAYGPLIGIGAQILRGTPSAASFGTSFAGLNGVPSAGLKFRFFRP